MPRQREELDPHGHADRVLELLAKETASWKLERLHIVRLALEGSLTYEQIAQARDVVRSTVTKHLKAFREGGIEALLARKEGKRGPKSPLAEGQREALRQGLAEGKWVHARHVRGELEQKHSVKVALSTVYKYLRQFKAKAKVTRKTDKKQKPEKTQAFRDGGLLDKLRELNITAGQTVRIWVQDEARFGLHTTHRRVWSLPGMRVKRLTQQKYQWDYAYGMLELEGQGTGLIRLMPTVSLADTASFLAELAESDPSSTHVVIYDGAGFHPRDGSALLPSNVRIVQLPPYSPELNPVEQLWKWLRGELAGEVFDRLDDLREKLTKHLEWVWSDPERVRRSSGYHWLRDLANVTGMNVCPP
jgi:transposase